MAHHRLTQVLRGQEENYLLPFFWQHGEEESVLRDAMEKIRATGIRAVCVESRPHPDFMGERWWRDMDIIVDEAKARGMKVWILDDAHFPTGYANGAAEQADDRLKKWHLTYKAYDVKGPLARHRFAAGDGDAKERLVAVSACARIDGDSLAVDGEFIDLTERVQDGWVRWDVPEGLYRVFVVTRRLEAAAGRNNYINLLVGDSVKLLLDAVYEPHYERYREEFGHTIAGFFSDEPGFYNGAEPDPFRFDMQIGTDMPLPWCDELPERLDEALGAGARACLPGLWHEAGGRTDALRYAYMETITGLYRQHFTRQLGEWCQARGVEYIGHIIEDNNAHARLGPSCGHFFRALRGQHMSGIDAVLQQIMPGMDYAHASMAAHGVADGEFYHYGLAKLGSSAAHIDPAARGRAMCELYGAYGWVEGLTLMKWLTDHMLVRGINHFVPHAFSEKAFPDPDCPPHFYARGNNPQYRHMHVLFNYANRAAHLLNGGRSAASVAVLYHGEAEWTGRAMPFQKVGKELMQAQIDYDVVPLEDVAAGALADGKLTVGNGVYRCLVVPYAEKLPLAAIGQIGGLLSRGFPVYFVEGIPQPFDGDGRASCLPADAGIVALADVAPALRLLGIHDIEPADRLPELRYYRYEHDSFGVTMFFNESVSREASTVIKTRRPGRRYAYDGFANTLSDYPMLDDETFPIRLAPSESLILVDGDIGADPLPFAAAGRERRIDPAFEVSAADYADPDRFAPLPASERLSDIAQARPGFAGIIRYRTVLTCADDALPAAVDLGETYEAAELFVNGSSAGVRISAPYRFSLAGLVRPGDNELVVEVATTLVHAQRDFISADAPIPPLGMLGPLTLAY